ncbi:MAG: autotransporter assembly complex protein TamA [Deltaproteobacteria bacterium]|nr:autotransporter assembly complex protein TamA [Deltaproteobacteria bacterium]
MACNLRFPKPGALPARSVRPLRAAWILALLLICLAAPLRADESVSIIVEGIAGDALKNVQEALILPSGLVRDGKADRLWLERFRLQADETVRTALEPFGYYHARIAATVEAGESGELRLRVQVEPGEPVRVTEAAVSLHGPGAEEASLKALAAAFPLAPGDVLLQQRYEEAKGALLSRAQELGYLDADFSVHEIRIAKPASSARIRLELETGRRYFFDGTVIEGAPGYPEAFLRRYLAYRPGEAFSYAGLGETQLNFTNSERFREVNITPEKAKSADFHIPVLVQLKPGPSRSLRQGVGYGTDTGGRLSLRYRDLNVLSRGHEFNSNLFISERLQGWATGYLWPDAVDIRSSTSLQLNLQREEASAYTSKLAALELARNRSLGKQQMGTAYIRLQRELFTVGAQDSGNRLVLPGLRYSGNFYDNLARPTRGFRVAFDLRGTHRAIGSDTELFQLISEGSHLWPLPGRLSLHTRARAGLTLWSDPLSDLPASLRFFAGGDQSVRGYAYQSLGPLDATGQVAGGKHLLVGSVELERALYEDWGVSAFYDAGNAFDSFSSVSLYQGAGVGLHYYTPVGALNLSLARQIGVEDPGFRIHFTVGFEF